MKHVWVEGLTPEDVRAFDAMVAVARTSENRELLLQIGAPGRLLVTGELAEVKAAALAL